MYTKLNHAMQSILTPDNFIAVQFNSTLLRGAGVPPNSLGVNGDYFLNRQNGFLYHKSGNIWVIETSLQGPAGESSYTYIAYASDANGTNFTMTFNPNLDFIAILDTTTKIANPTASNFVGLWKNYKGSQTNLTINAIATEPIHAGAFINVFGINGQDFVKNANATNSNSIANGFVLANYALGDTAAVYLDGLNTGLSNLVPETIYYLNTVDGTVSPEAPSNLGNIIQQLGIAVNNTTLDFDLQEYITVG